MKNNICLYITQNNCNNCTRCVLKCKVKALKFREINAAIIEERCVECGDCIDVCPSGVIYYNNSIDKVRRIIHDNENVAVSLSSVWVAEFPGVDPIRMIEALKLLGFKYVSQTAAGANRFASDTIERILNAESDIFISSLCPSVTSLIEKYYPELAKLIIPLATPTQLNSRIIKHVYGANTRVVSISSCVPEKSFEGKDIDAAITFEELKEWLRREKIDFDFIPGKSTYRFEPFEIVDNRDYIIPGFFDNKKFYDSHLYDIDIFSESGLDNIKSVLDGLSGNAKGRKIFLELYACKNGCLNGNGVSSKKNIAIKKSDFYRNTVTKDNTYTYIPDIKSECNFNKMAVSDKVSEESVLSLLDSMYIKDTIDCRGCGYDNCHDFAKSVILKYNSKDRCVWYQRFLASDKFSFLLKEMNSGVFIVDNQLKIVEANRNLANMLSAEARMIYDNTNGLKGVSIDRIFPFAELIASFIDSGDDVVDKDIQVKDRMLKVKLFTIKKHGLVCGMVRNLFVRDVNDEVIVQRTRKVINDNLETVQKIAYLLGENASRTEAVLNSIIESQTVDNDK